jgi:apolipoprotein N-acyltransferase
MDTTSLERAQRRAKALTDVIWHIGAFVILNGFFWLLDAITGGGITWAFWITIPWALALAFHLLAWYVQGRQIEERATDRYLDELSHTPH